MVKTFFFALGIALLAQTSICLDSAGGTSIHSGGVIHGDTLIVDNCDPNDPNSCGEGMCCAKEAMMYIPEYSGPKPNYRQICLDMGTLGDFCSNAENTGMCPCGTGYICKTTLGSFGHCAPIHK